MTNLKKFEDLVPGDKILYHETVNDAPEIGVFSHFNWDDAYFKWKDGQIMFLSRMTYEESCSALNEITITNPASKVLESRILFQQATLETLSKQIAENSAMKFVSTANVVLIRHAYQAIIVVHEKIGILKSLRATFDFDEPKDILLEKLKNFMVDAICHCSSDESLTKYVELASLIQEIEMDTH